MVRRVSQKLAEFVTQALMGFITRGHAMRFIDNHQIPVYLPEPWQDVRPFREIQRAHDLFLFKPLIDAKLIADVAAPQDDKLFVGFPWVIAILLCISADASTE